MRPNIKPFRYPAAANSANTMEFEQRQRRIKKELANITSDCDANKDLAITPVSDGDLTNLTAYILLPKESPRKDCIVAVKIKVPEDYPFKPLELYMMNEVWHPHLVASEQITLDFLQADNWKPGTTLHYCLLQVRRCLSEHELEPDEITMEKCCLINRDARDMFLQDVEEYKAKALEYAESAKGNEGKGEEDFNDRRLLCVRNLLSIPEAVNYNICIYRKKIDNRTVQLAFVFCLDGVFL